MRVLVTGVAGFWGSGVARSLLRDGAVTAVVGVDDRPVPQDLRGAIEFVGADLRSPDLHTALRGRALDACVHTDVPQFPEPGRAARALHDVNVVGTLQLLAALGEQDALRTLVVRGSAVIYGSEPAAPAFFTEDLAGRYALRTRWQRDVGELERLVTSFARRRPDVTSCVLRYQPVLGPTLDTPITRLFGAPVVPTYMGFDPRIQVVHEDDSVAALHAAVVRPAAGAVNVAGPGTVSLSQALRTLGRRPLPLAGPAFGPGARLASRLAGVPRINEDIARYLRYGRGVDTTRLEREVGFTPRPTARVLEELAA